MILWDHKFSLMWLTICMRLFPPCEVMTRRSGLRLLTIWGLGGGGGDLARTTFPKLLPFETVRSPGEALALVYPLAAKWQNQVKSIENSNRGVKGFLVYYKVTVIWRNKISMFVCTSKTGKSQDHTVCPKSNWTIAQLINHNFETVRKKSSNRKRDCETACQLIVFQNVGRRNLKYLFLTVNRFLDSDFFHCTSSLPRKL